MKRILAILVLIFITSLYAINIVYTINNEKPIIVKVDKFKKNIKLDTLKREVKIKTPEIISKNIIILEPKSPKIDRSLPDSSIHHNATWYKTDGTRVHREYQLQHIIMFQKEQNF